MNKILILFCLLFLSCSSDDNYSNMFNPPDWAIGKWVPQSNFSTYSSITFTSDNIVIDLVNGSTRSLSKFYNENDDSPFTFNEEINDNSYTYTIKYDWYPNTIISSTTILLSEDTISYDDIIFIKE